ncbi:MAG: hypothetical protein QM642_06345 [Edaphocola sp.]
MLNTHFIKLTTRIILIVLVVLFQVTSQGCFITNTPGFYSGYKKLTKEQQGHIKVYAKDASSHAKEDFISINGVQLREMLKSYGTSVVYMWSPNCHSRVCVPLNALKKHYESMNYQLFVVAEYYDFEKTKILKPDDIDMFSVNHKYYGTDYVPLYLKRFKKDLIGSREVGYERQLFFYRGQLIHSPSTMWPPLKTGL